jgi:class 3 adenylate cyclase
MSVCSVYGFELERLGGTVETFIGDAVVAVFGAPTAHEDDAERAVRAALAIRIGLVRTASWRYGSPSTPARLSSRSAREAMPARRWSRETW